MALSSIYIPVSRVLPILKTISGQDRILKLIYHHVFFDVQRYARRPFRSRTETFSWLVSERYVVPRLYDEPLGLENQLGAK